MGSPPQSTVGATVRLSELDRDPYPILDRLREHEPVSWVPETRMWFVTRRDDVIAVLRDAETYTTEADRSTIRDIFGSHMMTTDGEVALRYKRRCLHAFRADTLETDMRPWVRRRTEALVTAAPDDTAFDLIGRIASPLAVDSALRVLGLPLDLREAMAEWYGAFAHALANFTGDPDVRDRGHAAAAAFAETVVPLLTTLGPGDEGLLARLANETDDRFTNEEIVSNALIILFGGIETTESMIANTVWSLLVTDTWQAAAAPATRGPAIEEALRWQPAVQSITRHTTRDTVLRGVDLPAGAVVQCMIGGANRDPRQFAEAGRFDPDRSNAADHLSFGTGRHLCLGAHLARMEIDAVLETLYRRWPELVFATGEPPSLRGYEFRRPSGMSIAGRIQ